MRTALAAAAPTELKHVHAKAQKQLAELESSADRTRTWAVIDMDMFYAAVEMRERPELRDVPLGALRKLSVLASAECCHTVPAAFSTLT